MGCGHTECLAELDLLGFTFGQRRSKLWHEVQGERSLKQTVGTFFLGPLLLPFFLLEECLRARGRWSPELGRSTEGRTGEMESLCGADLPALACLAELLAFVSINMLKEGCLCSADLTALTFSAESHLSPCWRNNACVAFNRDGLLVCWGSFTAIPGAPLPHLPPPTGLGRNSPFWFSLHPTLQPESGGFRQKDNAKIALFVVIATMGFFFPLWRSFQFSQAAHARLVWSWFYLGRLCNVCKQTLCTRFGVAILAEDARFG